LGPEHPHAASVEDVILAYLIAIGCHKPQEIYAFTEHPLANLNVWATPPSHRILMRDSQLNHGGADIARKIWSPTRVVLAGDSSGGNTVASALLVMKLAGIPIPRAAILFSPWVCA
jgi:acetyl esterase/lipase